MSDKSSAEIRVTKDGPYLVSGELPLAKAMIGGKEERESIDWQWGKPFPPQKNFALCRCGHSAHKPFCDGAHAKVGFDGSSTAGALGRVPLDHLAKLASNERAVRRRLLRRRR